MISDPPCNARWIVELSNLNHERLRLQDMNHFVELLSTLMDLDADGNMFCSALHLKKWYELLLEEVEEVVQHKVLESEFRATQTTTV